MTLQGKGWYIWQIRRCENGVASAIAAQAALAGLSHVLIKIADGTSAYNVDTPTGKDLVPPVVQALKNQNIQCWGWQYVYGFDPNGEADNAIQRLNQIGMDGFVIDAEDQYTLPGRDAAARVYMSRVRAALPTLPIALSSYRYPTYHPSLPWQAFLEKCDLNMPQVYWVLSHNPAEQLLRSLNEFQAITPFRPIIPTGSAFVQGDWAPTTDDIIEFMLAAQVLNLSAVNFWEWGHTKLYLPQLWETVKNYTWNYVPPEQDLLTRYFNALNAHDPAQAAALYDANAVHVDGNLTVQGTDAIRRWYADLFNHTLPNAVFSLVSSSGDAYTKNFTWTANSTAGSVSNGNDSIGIVQGKIVYHYTYFTLQ